MDARIGKLSSGRYYAFAHGWDKPETVGTLAQVEEALGIRSGDDGRPLSQEPRGSAMALQAFEDGVVKPSCVLQDLDLTVALPNEKKTVPGYFLWNVTLRFQFPAWDEMDGIVYHNIEALTKSEANAKARRLARIDGHAIGGVGKYWFSAERLT